MLGVPPNVSCKALPLSSDNSNFACCSVATMTSAYPTKRSPAEVNLMLLRSRVNN
ncbi:Uncharacterised protein [Vibrio cholerae]|nr:Uncharacterised protein [Vibrio cholerae]